VVVRRAGVRYRPVRDAFAETGTLHGILSEVAEKEVDRWRACPKPARFARLGKIFDVKD
jgi:hypothetical protein